MDPRTHKMKVLVVEDDEASRLVSATLVRGEGHEVREATNGLEGFRMYESFKPDLIFSDISMPVMDGLKMLEKIRSLSHETIVIMTTAFGTADFTLKALRLHANDYLVKPILPQDFLFNLQKYQEVLANRSVDRDVVGLILNRQLTMRVNNMFGDRVGKVVDRLMQETEGRILPADRMGIRLGLLEMILNAIEHGNLGISYQEKTVALESGDGVWRQLVLDRMKDPPYKDRSVLIQFEMDAGSCEWTIVDEGEGFDWQKVPDPNDPENLMAAHGRGIMLTRLNFDEVTYQGRGNQVLLRKNLGQRQGLTMANESD